MREAFEKGRSVAVKSGVCAVAGIVFGMALLSGVPQAGAEEDVRACWYGSAGLHGALAYNDVKFFQKLTVPSFDAALLEQDSEEGEGARFRLTLGGGYQFKTGAFLGVEFIGGVGDIKTVSSLEYALANSAVQELVRAVVTQKESLGVQLLLGWTLDWAQPYLQGAWTNSRFVIGQGKTVTQHKNGWTIGAGVDFRVLPHLYLGGSVARTYYQDIHVESTLTDWFGTDKDYVRCEMATNEITLHVKVKT